MDLGVFVLEGPILYPFSGVHFSFWTAEEHLHTLNYLKDLQKAAYFTSREDVQF